MKDLFGEGIKRAERLFGTQFTEAVKHFAFDYQKDEIRLSRVFGRIFDVLGEEKLSTIEELDVLAHAIINVCCCEDVNDL